jgi:hypothetical protein
MAYGRPTTSFGQRRALGMRYGQDPALLLEQQRMEQEYAAQPERARLAEQIRQNNLLDQRRQEALDAQGKAAMVGTVGNVAGMGLQAAKLGKDMGWWSSKYPTTTAPISPSVIGATSPTYGEGMSLSGTQYPVPVTQTPTLGAQLPQVDTSINPATVDVNATTGLGTGAAETASMFGGDTAGMLASDATAGMPYVTGQAVGDLTSTVASSSQPYSLYRTAADQAFKGGADWLSRGNSMQQQAGEQLNDWVVKPMAQETLAGAARSMRDSTVGTGSILNSEYSDATKHISDVLNPDQTVFDTLGKGISKIFGKG